MDDASASAGLVTTEQVSGGGRSPLTVNLKKVRVEVVQGPDAGASAELSERHVIIGRAPECDLVLSDSTVSHMHLELALVVNGVQVRNLGSRNGVQVGAAQIEEAVIDASTCILVGRTVLRLSPMEAETRLPFAPVQRVGALIGRSLKMKMVFGLVQTYAQSDAPVLIEGATGTGKELAARAIHELSKRSTGPYEIVDCGAIPENLMEAELFGVARGAFTGADVAREGLFERASGGTVVLDEIGELPLALQPKLLGVLQRGQVRRLGETNPRSVQVRVVATTNRVLAREVQAGHFRQDLYFRLSVLRLTIPALRDRLEDIPLLVEDLLGKQNPFPAAWLRVLEQYDWPGNVRELRNVLERAKSQAPDADGLHLLVEGDGPNIDPLDTARREFERGYLRALLQKTGHNIRRAARLAGLTRQGLYGLLQRNGMRPTGNEE